MSFRTRQPTPATANVPIMPEQLSTNQQTVPVPMWWGRRKLTLRWITPAFDQLAIQAKDAPTKK